MALGGGAAALLNPALVSFLKFSLLPYISHSQLAQGLTRFSTSDNVPAAILWAVDSALEHERWCRARDRLRLQVARGGGAQHSTLGRQLQSLLAEVGLAKWEATIAQAGRPAMVLAELGKEAQEAFYSPAEAATSAAQQAPVPSPSTEATASATMPPGLGTTRLSPGSSMTALHSATTLQHHLTAATSAQYTPHGASSLSSTSHWQSAPFETPTSNGQAGAMPMTSVPCSSYYNYNGAGPYHDDLGATSSSALQAAAAQAILDQWTATYFAHASPALSSARSHDRHSSRRSGSASQPGATSFNPGTSGFAGGKRSHGSPAGVEQPARHRAHLQPTVAVQAAYMPAASLQAGSGNGAHAGTYRQPAGGMPAPYLNGAGVGAHTAGYSQGQTTAYAALAAAAATNLQALSRQSATR